MIKMTALTSKNPPRRANSTVFVGFVSSPCPFFIWHQLGFKVERQLVYIAARQLGFKVERQLGYIAARQLGFKVVRQRLTCPVGGSI